MIRTLILALAVALVIGCNRTDAPLQAQDRPDDKPAGSPKPKHAPRKKPKLPSPEEIAMLPPDGGTDYNRLIHEKSPYLRQHATNPVDWYPWGDEAFALAKKLDRPIFLSVGYSTCHWCHVMARQSFVRSRGRSRSCSTSGSSRSSSIARSGPTSTKST